MIAYLVGMYDAFFYLRHGVGVPTRIILDKYPLYRLALRQWGGKH